MDKPDLSLVSLEDLLKEAESRCECFVAAYDPLKTYREEMKFWYGKGRWFDAVRLADILHNDCMNNWRGEIKTLQRINSEENPDGITGAGDTTDA